MNHYATWSNTWDVKKTKKNNKSRNKYQPETTLQATGSLLTFANIKKMKTLEDAILNDVNELSSSFDKIMRMLHDMGISDQAASSVIVRLCTNNSMSPLDWEKLTNTLIDSWWQYVSLDKIDDTVTSSKEKQTLLTLYRIKFINAVKSLFPIPTLNETVQNVGQTHKENMDIQMLQDVLNAAKIQTLQIPNWDPNVNIAPPLNSTIAADAANSSSSSSSSSSNRNATDSDIGYKQQLCKSQSNQKTNKLAAPNRETIHTTFAVKNN